MLLRGPGVPRRDLTGPGRGDSQRPGRYGDLAGPRAHRFERGGGDARDLGDAVFDRRPGDAEPGRQLVAQLGCGEEARRLRVVEDEAGVEGAGHPVWADAEVGDDDVVVELRLESARGRVEVVRRHNAARRKRALPHAHLERVPFEVAQSPGDGLVERLEDRGARRIVALPPRARSPTSGPRR